MGLGGNDLIRRFDAVGLEACCKEDIEREKQALILKYGQAERILELRGVPRCGVDDYASAS